MLSAIAARKAAQASKLPQLIAHQATVSVESEQSLIQDKSLTSNVDSNQSQGSLKGRKRKISTTSASELPESPSWSNDRRTKKKKGRRLEKSQINNRRYYEPDYNKTAEEEDHIAILNGSGSPDSAETSDSEIGEEDSLASEHGVQFSLPVASTLSRNRSSSLSESESSLSATGGETFQRSKVDVQATQLTVSTVYLKPNVNLFHLGPSHVEGLKPGNACIAVILSPDESLSFAGAYSLTILKGAVSLYGAELRESPQSHRVFAPLCSPLPVITALSYLQLPASSNNGSVPGSFHLPPEILANLQTDQTLVVFQDLETGLEGMGRICKTFERAFKPHSSMSSDTILRTAEIVRDSNRFLWKEI